LRFKLSAAIVAKIGDHVSARGLGPDDLLFELRQSREARPRLTTVPDPETLGLTDPYEDGPGTTTAR
jgi:hypothetical protein